MEIKILKYKISHHILLELGMQKERVICLDMLLINCVFFNSGRYMEHMCNYDTCHMDMLGLLVSLMQMYLALLLLPVCCVYCHGCHFTCRIMRITGVWSELKKPW